MFKKGSLDLTKLNTVSPYLHLGVNSAYVLNISVTLHADHITGSVKSSVFLAYGEWILHKYRGSFFRKIMISSCDLTSCMAKLAGSSHRKSVQSLIHNVTADISLGFSDRNIIILLIHPELRGRYGVFCRTVAIDHLISTFSVMLEFLSAQCNKSKCRCILQKFCNQLTHLCREGYCGNLCFFYIFAYGNCILSDTLR